METRRLIITCEECGQVQYFEAKDESDVERIFSSFKCPNKCDRNFYSYITIGEIFVEKSKMNLFETVPVG